MRKKTAKHVLPVTRKSERTPIKATNLTAAFTAATAEYAVMTHDEVSH